jgi:ketosteroid isomerase-like protein
MTPKGQLVQKYFQLLESFETDQNQFEKIWHSEFLQTEFPNLISPKGQRSDFKVSLERLGMGRQLLANQSIEITNQSESGEQIFVEAIWSGTMAVEMGPLKKNQVVKAFLCMAFEFKDGKIFRQRNYDCYEPLS